MDDEKRRWPSLLHRTKSTKANHTITLPISSEAQFEQSTTSYKTVDFSVQNSHHFDSSIILIVLLYFVPFTLYVHFLFVRQMVCSPKNESQQKKKLGQVNETLKYFFFGDNINAGAINI